MIRIIYIVLLIIATNINTYSQSSFSASRLKEAIINHIMTSNSGIAEVEILQNISDISFPESGIHAELDADIQDCGLNRIMIKFRNNDRIVKFLDYSVRIKYEINALVAAQTIPVGQTFSETDFTYKKIISDNNCSVNITEIKQLIGKQASRNISKGTIMNSTLLAAETVIKRSEKVNIIVNSGAVRIRTMGTALQDGIVGQQIRIKRDSGGTLTGIVGDDGNVYLDANSLSKR
jgi:flagella basal body P-ring formation protein FlgA